MRTVRLPVVLDVCVKVNRVQTDVTVTKLLSLLSQPKAIFAVPESVRNQIETVYVVPDTDE